MGLFKHMTHAGKLFAQDGQVDCRSQSAPSLARSLKWKNRNGSGLFRLIDLEDVRAERAPELKLLRTHCVSGALQATRMSVRACRGGGLQRLCAKARMVAVEQGTLHVQPEAGQELTVGAYRAFHVSRFG